MAVECWDLTPGRPRRLPAMREAIGREAASMLPSGTAAERKAPAALGATLSQAAFFIDQSLAARLIEAQRRFGRAAYQFRAGAADDPCGDDVAAYREVVTELKADFVEIAMRAFRSVQKQLKAGELIANGILNLERFDVSASLWDRAPQREDAINDWLQSRLRSNINSIFAQIRVRPRYAVEREKAALATGDYYIVGDFLDRGMSDPGLALQVRKPLENAIEAGLITCPSAGMVRFPESLDEPPPLPVFVANWPERAQLNWPIPASVPAPSSHVHTQPDSTAAKTPKPRKSKYSKLDAVHVREALKQLDTDILVSSPHQAAEIQADLIWRKHGSEAGPTRDRVRDRLHRKIMEALNSGKAGLNAEEPG